MNDATSSPSPAVPSLDTSALSPQDRQWFANLLSVFTDPQYADHAQLIRAGNSAVAYEGLGGLLTLRVSHPKPQK